MCGGVGETARPPYRVLRHWRAMMGGACRWKQCSAPIRQVGVAHTQWLQHGHDSCCQMPGSRGSATGENCSQSSLASGRWSALPFTCLLNRPACTNSLGLPVAIQATCNLSDHPGEGSAQRICSKGTPKSRQAMASSLSPLMKGQTEGSKGAAWPAACRRPTTAAAGWRPPLPCS